MYKHTFYMYFLNTQALRQSIRRFGFRGIKPFLEHIGLHRNALDRFSRGAPVLPRSIELTLAALNLPLEHALLKGSQCVPEPITHLVETLHHRYPTTSIFLVNSRSTFIPGNNNVYTLGAYDKQGLPPAHFQSIVEQKALVEKQCAYVIECINLNDSSADFLHSIACELQLLAGYEHDRLTLIQRASVICSHDSSSAQG